MALAEKSRARDRRTTRTTRTTDTGVEAFGYKQELRRELRPVSLFAVAFAFISVTTGLYLNYGFGLAHAGPIGIWTWPVVGVGQVLVALVVADLGSRMPLAGYAYQWARRVVGANLGWLVAYAAILIFTIGTAAINYLIGAPIIADVLGWSTTNQHTLLAIAFALFAVQAAINIMAVRIAGQVSKVAMVTELVGTLLVATVLFVLWLTHAKPHTHGLSFLFSSSGATSHGIKAVALAGVMGLWSIIGFEVAADMAEETTEPRRNVPRAVVASAASVALVGMIALVFFTLTIPNLSAIANSPTPLPDIIRYWLGDTLATAFLVFVAFSIFALSVVSVAAVGRIIFAMARDDELPGSRALRVVNPRTQTPVRAVVVGLVPAIGFMLYGYFDGHAFETLVGASVILPYAVYAVIIVCYGLLLARSNAQDRHAGFLGRAAVPVAVAAFAWTVLAELALTLPREFRHADFVVLWTVLAGVVAYAVMLVSRRLSVGPNAVPGALPYAFDGIDSDVE